MTRWAVGLEYIGTRYRGWQAQAPGIVSLQDEFERALAKVADHPVALSAAGRTDAGVHAFQQVAHFDSDARRTPYAWLLGTNRVLPPDLSLRWVQPVTVDFHARHAAIARSYRYVIHNQRARSAWLADRAAWIVYPLDAVAMHRAAQALLGERDFSAYRASECQSPTPMRNVRRIHAWRRDDFVVLDITANAFLHHMVRNIAGVLIEIGQGRRPEPWAAELLEGRDRRRGPATAPAQGLYFAGPDYPARFELPVVPALWFPAVSPTSPV
jgi:tRNA pseudouridine38-40 synthase